MNVKGAQCKESVGQSDFGVSRTSGGGFELAQSGVVLVTDDLPECVHERALRPTHGEILQEIDIEPLGQLGL